MCWDAWQECAAKCATLSLSKCVPENGKLLGCVAGMCWDAGRECAAKGVLGVGENVVMRGGNGLGDMGVLVCWMCVGRWQEAVVHDRHGAGLGASADRE